MLLALLAVLVLALATGCQSTAGGSSFGGSGSGGSSTSGGEAAAGKPPQATQDTTRLCGKPPCMRFVSRGETRTLEDTFTNHPIVSAVAVHVVGSLLCGGILCLLGEGAGLGYVEHETMIASGKHECLKVDILPSGAEWKIIDIQASDESPYCKD